MFIDTHCHLTDTKFEGDLEEVVKEAQKNEIDTLIVPTTHPTDWMKAIKICEQFDQVYFLAGIHPEEVDRINITPDLKSLEQTLAHPKCVGIGEIGMDFFYDTQKKSLKSQTEIFTQQMDLAIQYHLPVAIHCRNAETETKSILSSMKVLPSGQFHCWGESADFLKYVLEQGFFVSFCGNLTFKNAQNLRDLSLLVPPERLLLETDSPYLAPEGRRGSRNTPANVRLIAQAHAQLRSLTEIEIGKITSTNSKSLYRI